MTIWLPTAILIWMLAVFCVVVVKAQRRSDFDWAEMFRDDSGKLSFSRFAAMFALAVSSWTLMSATIAPTDTPVLVALFERYLFVWSGAQVVMKLIEKWDGRTPWTRKEG